MVVRLTGPQLQDNDTPEGWGVRYGCLPEEIRLTYVAIREMIPEIHDREVIFADAINPRQRLDLDSSFFEWERVPQTNASRSPHLDNPTLNIVTLFYCQSVEENVVRSTGFSRLPLTVHAYLTHLPEILIRIKEEAKERASKAGETLQAHVDRAEFYDARGVPLEAVVNAIEVLWQLVNSIPRGAELVKALQESTQPSAQVWQPGKIVLCSSHTPHFKYEGNDADASIVYAKIIGEWH